MNNDAIQGQLMGAVIEVSEGMLAERGRGYASDKESWADIKRMTEAAQDAAKDVEQLQKDMWKAIRENDPDSYAVMMRQMVMSARDIAEDWVRICGAAMVAEQHTEE